MSISILGKTNISFVASTSSLYTPLAPGANPADQTLPRSATSTTVTFNAPSGGSGGYSYSASLSHVVGSGATLSGSGLGPYTVSSLQPGDVVEITLEITDTGSTTQIVYEYCVISVQGTYNPLVAAAAPADQNLAATATSSAPASFTAATGGSGAYSYSASLVQVVGSGATLSGSGLGPYTVNNLEFSDVVEVVLTTTDTGPVAQSVTSSFVVSVIQLTSAVVVAANPSNSSLPIGSTSSGPFTFTAPSGGSGSFTYSASLVEDVGSGSTLSGSGLGPYSLSGLDDGRIATIVLTSTDAGGIAQEVQNFTTTAVVDSYNVLNPAAAPPTVTLAAGTTSRTSINFTAATGGSGGYSYAAVLSFVRGTGASFSGSGLGPYSITNLEDEDIAVLTLTTTDAGPVAQSVTSRTYTIVEKAPLVAGADVGNEALPIGSTTSSSFTFNAPTGGSGSYNYAVTLSQLIGTGASLSGTGLGPYQVTGLNDGDVAKVTLTSTDTVTNQQVFNTTTIAVLQAATFTPLVAGSDPAAQILVAGSTSVNVTFNAPTGGTGSYSYSVGLEQTLGVGASFSGSGLGPYTVSGLNDGSAVKLTLTATDLGLVGQTVTSIAQIGVLTSAISGSWTSILDQDMTALDPVASFFSGSQPVTIGGVPWSTLTATRSGSTNGTTSIDASGLFVGGTSGINPLNVSLDLATPAGLNNAAMQLGSVVVQFQAQSIVLSGSNNYVSWGISVGDVFTDPVSVRKIYQFSGGYNIITQRSTTTIETLSGVGAFTEMVTSVVIIAGRLIFAKTDLGTTIMPDGYPDLSGYTYLGIAAETATTAQAYGNALKGFFLLRCSGTVSNYITRIRILKWS